MIRGTAELFDFLRGRPVSAAVPALASRNPDRIMLKHPIRVEREGSDVHLVFYEGDRGLIRAVEGFNVMPGDTMMAFPWPSDSDRPDKA